VCVSEFQMKKSEEEIYAEEEVSQGEESEEDVPEDMLEEYWEDDPNMMAGAVGKRGKEQKA
jgi:hypothetical protein